MIEPMTGPSSADQSLQLVGLDPDKLTDPLISPQCQALSPQFHGSASDPQENVAILLYGWDVELSHLIITHRSCSWKS